MNVLDKVKRIQKLTDDLMYTRDCPEDVIIDLKWMIEAFLELKEMLTKTAAESMCDKLELELNKKMEEKKDSNS